jgi:hypothetical protein
MSTNPKVTSETAIGEEMLQVYRGVKALFAMLVTLLLIPSTWRAVMAMLDQAPEAPPDDGGDIVVQFKAGKDL